LRLERKVFDYDSLTHSQLFLEKVLLVLPKEQQMEKPSITINRKKLSREQMIGESQFQELFKHMTEGFAHCQMIYKDGKPSDFIYLNVNPAFEKLTGLKDVIDKKVTEVIPGIHKANPELFEIYGRVASTGKTEKLETYVPGVKFWLSISVYSP